MSYDIIIFDPDLVPTDADGFAHWAARLFTRDEEPNFRPGTRSSKIDNLYRAARSVFPETTEEKSACCSKAAQYFLDYDHLEITFADSLAQAASRWVQDYAAHHGLGIYDITGTASMCLPEPV